MFPADRKGFEEEGMAVIVPRRKLEEWVTILRAFQNFRQRYFGEAGSK